MASPFAGRWQLYGRENCEALADSIVLPDAIKCALKSLRTSEEIHVNGDNVHVNIHVPTYSIPAHSKECNFTFGVEHTQPLPFGGTGQVTVKKESDSKWVGKITHDGINCTITREIRNGEMWVTLEGPYGKAVHKFERCTEGCGESAAKCSSKTGCSPFQGVWRLYGHDNFEKVMEAIGVPACFRCIIANTCVRESIHVNGDDVHVRACLGETIVPAHCFEANCKFGEEHEVTLPFGHRVKATGQKISDTKWQAKFKCEKAGEGLMTREIVGDEMWTTLEVKGKRVIHKFTRCGSCSGSASCGPASCKK